MAALQVERTEASFSRNYTAETAIGQQLHGMMAMLTVVNERIKYLRKIQDSIIWRKAVKELLGEDAYEQCAAWIAANDEAAPFRREWARPKSKAKMERLNEKRRQRA